jgi:hypothetical protein
MSSLSVVSFTLLVFGSQFLVSSSTYRIVFPVRRRIHWGMGLFCFAAFASFCLVRKVLWACNLRLASPSLDDCRKLESTYTHREGFQESFRVESTLGIWRVLDDVHDESLRTSKVGVGGMARARHARDPEPEGFGWKPYINPKRLNSLKMKITEVLRTEAVIGY